MFNGQWSKTTSRLILTNNRIKKKVNNLKRFKQNVKNKF